MNYYERSGHLVSVEQSLFCESLFVLKISVKDE